MAVSMRIGTWLVAAWAFSGMGADALVDFVDIATRRRDSPVVRFWYRIPRDAASLPKGERMHVLVLFGGRNCDGQPEVSGKLGWTDWADGLDVVLVAPSYRDGNYWEPETWSGPALFRALALIAARYPVSTDGLLYYGYSAGSQASNLFAAWRPERCRGWVSHACGVFHVPSRRMRNTPGLVTCGDADVARYILSRDFVARSTALGNVVVWRSYPNHPHDVPSGSVRLAQAFLAHCHVENRRDLGVDGGATGALFPFPYTGDDLEGTFHPADSVDAQSIPPADRVPLPNRAVAEAWGRPGEGASPAVHGEARISSFTFAGVPFVLREPTAHSPTSRVAVLFGGRNWPGGRTLEAFGFDAVAERFRMFLLAPSFDDGIPFRPYWEPRSGTGRLLLRAVGEVERRFDLAPGHIALYGYSAGGQCAALFASYLKGRVAAWGAHACGVFPEPPRAGAPALVTCGVGDVDRLRIGRTFACRYREAGGALVWRTMEGGHELGASALGLARAFFGAVASGAPCACWGEDGTWRVLERERIDPEYRSPLYTPALAELWRRPR